MGLVIDKSRQWHEDPRLSRDVRAQVPAAASVEECQSGDGVYPRHPFGLRLLGGLDGRQTLSIERRDHITDVLDVLLDRHDHVGEHRRAAGTGDGEQVRETCHLKPQKGRRARRPRRAGSDRLDR